MDGKDAIIARQQELIQRLTEQNQVLAERDQLLAEQNQLLIEQVAAFQRLVEELRDKISKLEKNSRNSSKPPSSDIVKPTKSRKPRGCGKRSIGGQKARGFTLYPRGP